VIALTHDKSVTTFKPAFAHDVRGGADTHRNAAYDWLARFLPRCEAWATEADAVGEKEVILRRRS
jgi:hypothetical protein